MALVLSSDTVKIGLVIAVVTLMNSCLCAPTTESSPWWFQPCATEIRLRADLRLRHNRPYRSTKDSVHLSPVVQQFKIFINQLKDSQKKIEKLYTANKNQQGKSRVPHAKLPWLKLKQLLMRIKNAPKEERLDKVYIALQYFAGTLDTLWNLSIDTIAVEFKNEKRRDIYQNIMYHLRSLLCEMQDEFKLLGRKVPNGLSLKMMKIPASFSATKNIDFTAGHLLDINFFKKMSVFFKRTNKILKTKKSKSRKSAVSAKSKKRTQG